MRYVRRAWQCSWYLGVDTYVTLAHPRCRRDYHSSGSLSRFAHARGQWPVLGCS